MSARMFFGQRGGPGLFGGGGTYLDAGIPYVVRAESNPIAAADLNAEAGFFRLHLVLAWSRPTLIVVTPVLDGVGREPIPFVLPELSSRAAAKFRAGLALPVVLAGIPIGKCAMRGTWFSVRVEASADTDISLQAVSVEAEHARDRLTAVNAE
jgi:hypothetical protein